MVRYLLLLILLVVQCGGDHREEESGVGWKTPIPINAFDGTPPIVYGDNVIVQIVDSLWALDLETGVINWRLALQEGCAVTPTVPQYENYAFYCGRSAVFKVDVAVGAIEWVFPTAFLTSGHHLAIDSTSLHFGTAGGAYYEVDLETGEMVRYYSIPGESVVSALPRNGRLYITSFHQVAYTGHLTCLGSAGPLWSVETSAIISKPAFYGDQVIVSEFPNSTVFYNRDTGEETQRYDSIANCHISPLVEGDYLYVGAGEHLAKIDLLSGVILYRTNYGVNYDPVSIEDRLVVNFAYSLGVYAKSNGRMELSFRPGGHSVISNPCYYDGMVYFIGSGHIYAFWLDDLLSRW
jgi:outer membrane protein assembly factor BamB